MFGLLGDLFGGEKHKEQNASAQQKNNANNAGDIKDTGAFSMRIENVFSIMGRGTVVTGTVEQGVVRLHDTVTIENGGIKTTAEVTGIEVFNQTLDFAQAGQNVGLMFNNIQKFDPTPNGRIVK